MTKQWIKHWETMPYSNKIRWSERYMLKGHIKDMTPVQVMSQINNLVKSD